MRVATYCCLLFLAFSFLQSNAQSSSPLTHKTVDITLSEGGRLKTPPGFAFVEGYSYDINLKIEKPQAEHKAFLKNFKTRIQDTYEKLDDESYPFTALYSHLWSPQKYKQIKQEYKDLIDILSDGNPEVALGLSTNNFPSFLGKAFLQKALFGDSYRIYTDVEGAPKNVAFNSDNTILIQNWKPTGDTATFEIFTSKIENQFLYDYFAESRKRIAANLNVLKTKSFYSKMASLRTIDTDLTALAKQLTQSNTATILCDPILYNRFLTLTKALYNDDFVKALQAGWVEQWVQQWLWRMDGNIALNPLGFTDEKLLATRSGFDTARAKAHDAHRASVVEGMIASKELNDKNADLLTFDTALKQQGKGSEIYSHASFNKTLAEDNKKKWADFQPVITKRLSFKLPVVEKGKVSRIMYRHYDASNQLKGSIPEDVPTVPNKTSVAAVVYNLVPQEEPKLTESPVETPNESSAVTSLKEAGSTISGLLGEAGPLTGILANFVGGIRSPGSPIPPVNFTMPQLKATTSGNKKFDLIESVVIKYFTLTVTREKGSYFVLVTKENKTVNRISLTAEIETHLKGQLLSGCTALKSLINEGLESIKGHIDDFPDTDMGVASMNNAIAQLQKQVNDILQAAFQRLDKNRILNSLSVQSSIASLLSSPSFYTLPPAEFEADKGKVPSYRNEFIPFADEKKAVEKNAEIVVTNVEKKTEKKRKDMYVTAPTTLLTPSLGIAYIFDPFRRSEVKVENGAITNNTDEEQLRIIAGLHIHFAPMLQKDNRNIFQLKGRALLSRISVFAGVSFPKPFYNLHPGLSADVWPGVKVMAGAHFYRFTNYTVLNNQIIDQKSGYVFNSGFASINIDPVAFVKLIGIIK